MLSAIPASASPYTEAYATAQALEKDGQFAKARIGFEIAEQAADTSPEKIDALIHIGGTHASEKNFAAAYTAYEKALLVTGITPEQSGRALLKIADGYYAENKFLPMRETLEKVQALKNLPDGLKIKAHIAMGRLFLNYSHTEAVERVKQENLAALEIPGIGLEEKATAQQSLIKAQMILQEYAEARILMRQLLANETLSEQAKRTSQVLIGKILMLEKNYPEARTEFAKALDMPDVPDAVRADIQLQIGLSYYEERNFETAKADLMKVLDMPGANGRPPWDGGRMANVPAREALLRLHFAKLLPGDKKLLKVLFIGSSHTLRGDVPGLVMQLAESAPADRPRILAGDFIRLGTTITSFWNVGDNSGTARGLIAAENWDAVVFETFYNMNADELLKYGVQFADLIKSKNARPVIYESPIAQAKSYPEEYMQFHNNSLALANAVEAPIAPSVLAWMKLLGPKPTPENVGAVYADWIHATPKGAYLTACCIYAALTGFSPVGLAHPDLPEAEGRELQELAWKAFLEANPSVKR